MGLGLEGAEQGALAATGAQQGPRQGGSSGKGAAANSSAPSSVGSRGRDNHRGGGGGGGAADGEGEREHEAAMRRKQRAAERRAAKRKASAAAAAKGPRSKRVTTAKERRQQRQRRVARTQLTEQEVQERQRQKETEMERANSRTLSNSGFAKRYHKPPFGLYGTGNLRPVDGGLMYGNYMASYNVAPLKHPANPKSEEAMDAVRFTYNPAVLRYKPPKRSFTDRLKRAKELMAEGLSPEEIERAQAVADGAGAEEALIESVRLELVEEYGAAAAERIKQREEERARAAREKQEAMSSPEEMTEEMRKALGGRLSGDATPDGRELSGTQDPHAMALAEAEARKPDLDVEAATERLQQLLEQKAAETGRPPVPAEPVQWRYGTCLAQGQGGASFKVSDVYALPQSYRRDFSDRVRSALAWGGEDEEEKEEEEENEGEDGDGEDVEEIPMADVEDTLETKSKGGRKHAKGKNKSKDKGKGSGRSKAAKGTSGKRKQAWSTSQQDNEGEGKKQSQGQGQSQSQPYQSVLAEEARARAAYASGELVESDVPPALSVSMPASSGVAATMGRATGRSMLGAGAGATVRLVEFDASLRSERDPRVFKYLPRGMERSIAPAGRPTAASDHVPQLLDQFD